MKTLEELIVKQFDEYEINHDTHYIDDSREAVIDSLKPLIYKVIIDAYEAGFDNYYTTEKTAEQYYNETFKKD